MTVSCFPESSIGKPWEATAGFSGAAHMQLACQLPSALNFARMDTRMKSSCSRSSSAPYILGSRSSQPDDINANRDANRHHWSCDIDPQEPQMMKLR
jgi:hypothetical protein